MTIHFTASGASLLPQRVEKPTLSAAMTTEVFLDITSGAYSPVRAFRESKLTLRGSLDLAEAILRGLGGPAAGPAGGPQAAPLSSSVTSSNTSAWRSGLALAGFVAGELGKLS